MRTGATAPEGVHMWEKLFDRMAADDHPPRHAHMSRCRTGAGSPRATARAPEIAIRLTDPDLPRRILLDPDLGVGEGYMDGTLLIEGDDLRGFLALAMRNLGATPASTTSPASGGSAPLALSRRAARRWHQWNPAPRARANVAHHYDLSGALYDLFLDADKQYSCAYFADPAMTLEEAQPPRSAISPESS
jgi:cyclopropane-fatty-acyl-phospholipid synthase